VSVAATYLPSFVYFVHDIIIASTWELVSVLLVYSLYNLLSAQRLAFTVLSHFSFRN